MWPLRFAQCSFANRVRTYRSKEDTEIAHELGQGIGDDGIDASVSSFEHLVPRVHPSPRGASDLDGSPVRAIRDIVRSRHRDRGRKSDSVLGAEEGTEIGQQARSPLFAHG